MSQQSNLFGPATEAQGCVAVYRTVSPLNHYRGLERALRKVAKSKGLKVNLHQVAGGFVVLQFRLLTKRGNVEFSTTPAQRANAVVAECERLLVVLANKSSALESATVVA